MIRNLCDMSSINIGNKVNIRSNLVESESFSYHQWALNKYLFLLFYLFFLNGPFFKNFRLHMNLLNIFFPFHVFF